MNREAPAPLLLETRLGPREALHSLDFLVLLAEEYSDNAEQEEEGREEYRTILGFETVYRYERGRGFLSLANALSGEYEARAEVARLGFVKLVSSALAEPKREVDTQQSSTLER